MCKLLSMRFLNFYFPFVSNLINADVDISFATNVGPRREVVVMGIAYMILGLKVYCIDHGVLAYGLLFCYCWC